MKKSLKNIPVNAIATSVDNVEFDYSEEEDEDADLIRLVEERLANDSGIRYTMEEIDKMYGFTEEDLEGWEEVKIE